jgi:hypothetical protein
MSTLKNMENKNNQIINFQEMQQKKWKPNTSYTISKSLKYKSFKSKDKKPFSRCVLPNSKHNHKFCITKFEI